MPTSPTIDLDSAPQLDAAERVERSVDKLDEAVSQGSPTTLDRIRVAQRELEDQVLDLSLGLPKGRQDFEARKLFEFAVQLRRAFEGDDPDLRPALLLLVQFKDILKSLERKLEHTLLEDPGRARRYVVDALAGSPSDELAALLNEPTPAPSRPAGSMPARPTAERTVLVAQLIMYLRSSMTARGLLLWFRSASGALEGASPLELLAGDIDAAAAVLRPLARGARGQLDA